MEPGSVWVPLSTCIGDGLHHLHVIINIPHTALANICVWNSINGTRRKNVRTTADIDLRTTTTSWNPPSMFVHVDRNPLHVFINIPLACPANRCALNHINGTCPKVIRPISDLRTSTVVSWNSPSVVALVSRDSRAACSGSFFFFLYCTDQQGRTVCLRDSTYPC